MPRMGFNVSTAVVVALATWGCSAGIENSSSSSSTEAGMTVGIPIYPEDGATGVVLDVGTVLISIEDTLDSSVTGMHVIDAGEASADIAVGASFAGAAEQADVCGSVIFYPQYPWGGVIYDNVIECTIDTMLDDGHAYQVTWNGNLVSTFQTPDLWRYASPEDVFATAIAAVPGTSQIIVGSGYFGAEAPFYFTLARMAADSTPETSTAHLSYGPPSSYISPERIFIEGENIFALGDYVTTPEIQYGVWAGQYDADALTGIDHGTQDPAPGYDYHIYDGARDDEGNTFIVGQRYHPTAGSYAFIASFGPDFTVRAGSPIIDPSATHFLGIEIDADDAYLVALNETTRTSAIRRFDLQSLGTGAPMAEYTSSSYAVSDIILAGDYVYGVGGRLDSGGRLDPLIMQFGRDMSLIRYYVADTDYSPVYSERIGASNAYLSVIANADGDVYATGSMATGEGGETSIVVIDKYTSDLAFVARATETSVTYNRSHGSEMALDGEGSLVTIATHYLYSEGRYEAGATAILKLDANLNGPSPAE